MQKFSIFSLVGNALSGHERWKPFWRDAAPRERYDVIIVGGGGHGLATAYYLAKNHGIRNVAVLEKGWIGGGNTGRNTTIVRSNYLWNESGALYEHALKLWEGLNEELNINLMFSQRGVLNLAHNLADVREGRRRVEANRLNGIDGEWLTPAQVKAFCSIVDVSPAARYPVMGATLQRRGGTARHDTVAWGYARAADALGVDTVQPVRVDAALGISHFLQGVREVQHAALAEHHVIVEVPRQAFEKLQRLLVELRRFVPQIVRADDRGISRRIAAAQPSFLEHGDIAYAVLFRQVVGGREPVTAAADDHDLIFAARFGAAPRALPVLVVRKRVPDETEYGVALHMSLWRPNLT